MFSRFPPDARWNAEQSALEFGIGVGEYEGIVQVPRRAFQGLLDHSPTPKRVSKPIYLYGTRLELIVERKVRCRHLMGDGGNVEVAGRDVKQGEFCASTELHSAVEY